ncbi:phosphate-starvation-inducible PsiE family protein [Oculatella sp. LEGE 06141]|uniref:phosphate-starvation-inducible PsiE family protein n=1 Tax=Oculatella sp. LEGE 06141 TaxID=1828648 RepID=UPI001882DB0E|nr:phosphate-starvation-inducible PsiE family protein [Oculatella sp. LEGE 06141]MBE9177353.1 phosphate-starvation-inducible PsiE family protein [Oculatella sp. LEGE 06141]
MRKPSRSFFKRLFATGSDENFLKALGGVETLVSKILSIAMVVVLLVAVADLCLFLAQQLLSEPYGSFSQTLIEIFGLFLNILIALEVLENITAYLRRHIVQVELVIVTSLTAVARKIIIFDFNKAGGLDLIGLAVASLALALSYWIVRRTNRSTQP